MKRLLLSVLMVLAMSVISTSTLAVAVCSQTCSPDGQNSLQCSQSLFECVPGEGDHKSKTRDAFGECKNGCCKEDNFGGGAQCINDQCGAECAVDADCDQGTVGQVGKCSGNCLCTYENQIPEFGTIAALVALAGAVTAFVVIRKH